MITAPEQLSLKSPVNRSSCICNYVSTIINCLFAYPPHFIEKLSFTKLTPINVIILATFIALFFSVSVMVVASAAEKFVPPTVKAMRISPQAEENILTGMGSIACPRSIELGFDDTGVIAQMFVEEGEAIQQGQVIASLDDSSFRAARLVAEAKLQAARAEVAFYANELTKKESLLNKKAVSDAEFNRAVFELQKAEAAVAVAQAELQRIDIELQKKILIAPISGIVAKRYLDVGSPVVPGSNKTILLIQCNDVFADIELGERLFPSIKVGQPVRVKMDALGGKMFAGTVFRIGSEIDKKSRTFIIKVKVANPKFVLRPGMFARAEIILSEGSAPVYIPEKALIHTSKDGSAADLFVIKNGVSLKRKVTLGESNEGRIQILRGVSAGDVVIIEGQNRTSDLDEVNMEFVK